MSTTESTMKYEARIPVNDWKPAPLREDKVNEAVASIVNTGGGALYIGYSHSSSTPACREGLTPNEIRYICRRFIEARWHVYLPSSWDGVEPITMVFVSKLPSEVYNCGVVDRSIEITDANGIRF